MTTLRRLARRLRYGEPIVVVSGTPRSGTSMAMRMLHRGGFPILTDGVRTADPDNPHGYYEFERVKGLDKGDTAWLANARGKAVKVISTLLTWLPETYEYQVIFMERDLAEAVASQNIMLRSRGAISDPGSDGRLVESYREHLVQVHRFMARRRCFSALPVRHRDAIEQPAIIAQRINAFLGGRLDETAMAAAVDPCLYRNRGATASVRCGG